MLLHAFATSSPLALFKVQVITLVPGSKSHRMRFPRQSEFVFPMMCIFYQFLKGARKKESTHLVRSVSLLSVLHLSQYTQVERNKYLDNLRFFICGFKYWVPTQHQNSPRTLGFILSYAETDMTERLHHTDRDNQCLRNEWLYTQVWEVVLMLREAYVSVEKARPIKIINTLKYHLLKW